MPFAVEGASNLRVRGANAREFVDVPTIAGKVFALIGIWVVPKTPMGEPCHVLQWKLHHALEAASPTHVKYMPALDGQRALYIGHSDGSSCKSVSRTMCSLLNALACN